MDELESSEKKKIAQTNIEEEWREVEKMLAGVAKEQKPHKLVVLNEIFKAVVKLAKDNPGTLNLKITATVLKELRYSFKLFSPHRMTPKITMFGSARTPPGTPLYKFAKDFGTESVKRGFQIITGGGPGIMEAGNRGAAEAEGKSVGLNIELPLEQERLQQPAQVERAEDAADARFRFRRGGYVPAPRQLRDPAPVPAQVGDREEDNKRLQVRPRGEVEPVAAGAPADFGEEIFGVVRVPLREDFDEVRPGAGAYEPGDAERAGEAAAEEVRQGIAPNGG